jgi:hypothetical protein
MASADFLFSAEFYMLINGLVPVTVSGTVNSKNLNVKRIMVSIPGM